MAPKKAKTKADDSSPKSPAKSPKKGEDVDMSQTKGDDAPKKAMDVEWSAAAADKRARTKLTTAFTEADAMASFCVSGTFVSTIARDGFQCLISGGRASTGIKQGRYLFEATVLDAAGPSDGADAAAFKTIRVGVATSEAGLVPGADAESFAVDNIGHVWTSGKGWGHGYQKQNWQWKTGDVVGVFVNLDKASPNAHTLSLFCNGARLGPPIALPEQLHGKTLFPILGVRRAAVSVNFGKAGARPLRELPFKATLLDAGAHADLVESTAKALDKPEVIVPVGLPNEATRDFLDLEFYPNNKGLEECSQRAIARWLTQSGLTGDAEKPESFKVKELDDGSIFELYIRLLASRRRSCVIVQQLPGNLRAASRAKALRHFSAPWWTKKALVSFGKAPAAFTKKLKESIVAAKQAKLDSQVKKEKEDYERRKARDADKAGPEPDWAAKAKVADDFVADITGYRTHKHGRLDMRLEDLDKVFADFSIPVEGQAEAVDPRWQQGDAPAGGAGEGFDAVEFAAGFSTKAQAAKYLEAYKKERKVQAKVADLVPGPGFPKTLEQWARDKVQLRANISAFHGRVKAQKAREAKPKEEPKEEPKEGEAAEGEAPKEEPKEEPKDVEMKEPEDLYDYAAQAEKDADVKKPVHDTDGHKTPLYHAFELEDHLQLQLRAELHILVQAFASDVTAQDKDRTGITVQLLRHYYNIYFKHALNAEEFGHKDMEALLKAVSDTIAVKDGVLSCTQKQALPTEFFLQRTEEARRSRKLRLSAGDESCRLVFKSKEAKGQKRPGGAPPVQPKGFGKGPPVPLATMGGGFPNKGMGNMGNMGGGFKGGPAPGPGGMQGGYGKAGRGPQQGRQFGQPYGKGGNPGQWGNQGKGW